MGQADDAEAAGLVVDELQVRTGQRNARHRRDLVGVYRVDLLYAVLAERLLPMGARSESRNRATIVTVPVGGAAMSGTSDPSAGRT